VRIAVEFQPLKPLDTFELVGGRGGARNHNSGDRN